MDISLYDYSEMVKGYSRLQEQLHSVLDAVVHLHTAKIANYHFAPSKTYIREQIKHWPSHIPFVMPPVSWVSPQQGSVNHKNKVWSFAFHEAGLSLVGRYNRLHIGIAYCREGQIGVTRSDVWRYLQTVFDRAHDFHCSEDDHLALFGELIRRGYLLKREPLSPGDTQTYILQ